MRTRAPDKFWMVRGAAGLAPYYGIARRKKDLKEKLYAEGISLDPWQRFVRVEVVEKKDG